MRRALSDRSLIGCFNQALEKVAAKSGKLIMEHSEKGTINKELLQQIFPYWKEIFAFN